MHISNKNHSILLLKLQQWIYDSDLPSKLINWDLSFEMRVGKYESLTPSYVVKEKSPSILP